MLKQSATTTPTHPNPFTFSAATAAPELKRGPCRFKSLDTATGTFSGYASLFGVPDLSGDVVVAGAFRRSLIQRGTAGIKLLYQHDPAQPIGVWVQLVQDNRGLFVTGRLLPDVAKAREVLALMRAGALDGLSIGFRTVKGSRDPTNGLRRLQEIDLWEISVVTFPMQPDARVSTIKGKPPMTPAATPPTERQVLTRLRRATRQLTGSAPATH